MRLSCVSSLIIFLLTNICGNQIALILVLNLELAQNADLIVHESTNAYLEGIDVGSNMYLVNKDARMHGHSTPQIAGEFAKRVYAKKLILNHFSSRYKGDESLESIAIMTRIEKQAIEASGLGEDSVAAAWDFMTVPIATN